MAFVCNHQLLLNLLRSWLFLEHLLKPKEFGSHVLSLSDNSRDLCWKWEAKIVRIINMNLKIRIKKANILHQSICCDDLSIGLVQNLRQNSFPLIHRIRSQILRPEDYLQTQWNFLIISIHFQKEERRKIAFSLNFQKNLLDVFQFLKLLCSHHQIYCDSLQLRWMLSQNVCIVMEFTNKAIQALIAI